MKKIIALVVAVLFICAASIATAASPQDVQKVIHVKDRNSLKFIRFEGHSNGPFKCVYYENGKYYRLFYGGPKDRTLTFWIQTPGSKKIGMVVTDHGLDGKIDYGSESGKKGEERVGAYDAYSEKNAGRQNRHYWQKIFDTAIADNIRHFR